MLSLYVHIPFCRERCPYCDFFLVTRLEHVEPYFHALCRETAAKAPFMEGQRIRAIHFGGGTPSLVPVSMISGWLVQVARLVRFEPDLEITLEANPEDLNQARLDELRHAGVNRLSIGVQSFLPGKLRSLGRAHSASDSRRTVDMALERFGSVAVDLICGAAGEDLEAWEEDLRCARESGVQHVSVYMLTLEEKTRLWRDVRRGTVSLPDESMQAAMYELARTTLTGSGYRHYEISNFAREGFHSRYNLASWMREPYLGFGPSAHSFMVSGGQETRFANDAALVRYLADPAGSATFREVLTPEQRFDETVFLSLRIGRPLSLVFLHGGHPDDPARLDAAIGEFLRQGWISIENGALRLTGPGCLFADLVASGLIG